MTKSVLAIAMVVLVAASPVALAQQQAMFGAIAYSPQSRVIGVAADNFSQAEAESVALGNCRRAVQGDDDCRVIVWVRNACAALAVSREGAWGSAWAPDRAGAERKTLALCAQHSSTCEIVRRVCISRS